jgi:hypothetical protein
VQYKTIVLELLKQQTEFYDLLRITRRLLPTLEVCAQQLKDNHESWKETLSQVKPDSDMSQINSQALELALKELEDRLHSLSPQDDGELPTLDNAMAYLVGRTSIN